jgi:hypothetical protein
MRPAEEKVQGMRRAKRGAGTAVLVGAALALGSLGAARPAGAGTPGPGWSPTATAATDLVGATDLGPAPGSSPMPLIVTLRPRDPAGLDRLLAAQADPASPQFHRYLTPGQFTAAQGATPEQVAAVTGYLRAQGMTDIAVAPNRLSVSAEATAGSASRAFATRIATFARQGGTVVANTAPALVPPDLAGVVGAVVGLDQAAAARPLARPPATSRPPLASTPPRTDGPAAAASSGVTDHAPDQFPGIYDAASLPTAASTTVAVMAEGDLGPVISDLRTAENVQSLPEVPVTTVQTGPASSDTSSQLEWDLDTQAVTGMAGTVRDLYLYDAPTLDDVDITAEVQRWVTDDSATVASASFGLCDSDAQSGGVASAIDQALAQAQAQGQAFFAASGDTGASCVTSEYQTVRQASYPASSPYATGVGGTVLTTSGPAWAGETAWNDVSGASGGGISSEPRPGFADDADTADSADAVGAGRGVPDMAMDAAPSSGADIIVAGATRVIGGTSLASPLAAGAWARMESAHQGNLGLASSDLYGLYNARYGAGPGGATPGLHDVTRGDNSANGVAGYQAHAGYDLTTGLGTFDTAQVSAELDVPPRFTADTPPATATVTEPYSYGYAATGSPTPVYAVTSGSPPPGLTLNSTTGALTGTPTEAGTYTFQVTAANGVAPNATSPPTTIGVGEPASGGDAVFQGSTGNLQLARPVVGMAVDPATGGYWLVASDGGIFSFNAPFLGSAGNLSLEAPIVGMAATPDGGGYYLVAADGGVFNYGDAHFHGSAASAPLAQPVVGMAVDPATGGYWLTAADGGVFAFGAPFDGSAASAPLARPVVGMAATPDGAGYWLTASDGGVFTFGDAPFRGSAASTPLARPVVGMAATPDGGGYWLDASDGGVFTFGSPFFGSAGDLPLARPVVGMAATPSGRGYYLVAADGGVFTY